MNIKYFPVPCTLDDEVKILQIGKAPLPAFAMDISETGMRVRFDEQLEPGTPIKIHMDFTKPDFDIESVEVDAEVLNRFPEPDADTWQVGVRLKFTSAVQEKNLLTYLSSCEGMF